MDLFKDIVDFHEKFDLAYTERARTLPVATAVYRIQFMQEELNEYIASFDCENLEGQFDALIDLVYVALGTAYMQGFNFNEGWARVHEANMRKVRASNEYASKRKSSLDVIKPEGWQPPYLGDLL